jgi:hypothetical protein
VLLLLLLLLILLCEAGAVRLRERKPHTRLSANDRTNAIRRNRRAAVIGRVLMWILDAAKF